MEKRIFEFLKPEEKETNLISDFFGVSEERFMEIGKHISNTIDTNEIVKDIKNNPIMSILFTPQEIIHLIHLASLDEGLKISNTLGEQLLIIFKSSQANTAVTTHDY